METGKRVDSDWKVKSTNINTGFSVRHLVIVNKKKPHDMCLRDTSATDERAGNIEIDLFINTDSDEMHGTGNAALTEKVKFFNMHDYGRMNFTGHDAARIRNGCSLYGDLTINGVSRRMKLEVEFGGIKDEAGKRRNPVFLVNGSICRMNWGANWNAALEANGYFIDEELRISCEVQLTDEQRLAYYYSFFYSIYSSQSKYLQQRKTHFMGG